MNVSPPPGSPPPPVETPGLAGSDAAPTGPVLDFLDQLIARFAPDRSGNVATYIPELAKVDPELFGIAVATVDGVVYACGDADHRFTLQSVSKPFVYGYALAEYGREAVLRHVGVEPTGEAFNAIVLDDVSNRPYNPMVNAGAMAIAELVRGDTAEERVATMLAIFERFAGRALQIDETVFCSEQATGHRNRAIAYMMLNSGMISRAPEEILDVYFRQCSVEVTCRDLALMAATLANDGIHPVTGLEAMPAAYLPDVLTVMNSCGMYNYAGQWSYEVGMPAKSGVSGGIIAVIPGQVGIGVFSPRLDPHGNSVRGVHACRAISEEFGLHVFRNHINTSTVVRRQLGGKVIRSKRMRSPEERAYLDQHGERIAVVEAQGPLFFGAAERLVRRIEAIAATADHIILDCRRVHSADPAARNLILRQFTSLGARARRLLFAHVEADGPLAALRADLTMAAERVAETVFPDTDAALEWCENQIIATANDGQAPTKFSLGSLDIFRGLGRDELKLLEAVVRPLTFEPGEFIVREGDEARLFFVMARGTASVELTVASPTGRRRVRVASIGPGVTFGEMALLDGGRRSADVVADDRVVCYGFSVEQLRELGHDHGPLLVTILTNMMRDFSERLRRANDEIRALET